MARACCRLAVAGPACRLCKSKSDHHSHDDLHRGAREARIEKALAEYNQNGGGRSRCEKGVASPPNGAAKGNEEKLGGEACQDHKRQSSRLDRDQDRGGRWDSQSRGAELLIGSRRQPECSDVISQLLCISVHPFSHLLWFRTEVDKPKH